MDIFIQPETKWIIWTIITCLSTYLYVINPIRYSPSPLFRIKTYEFTISKLYNILKFIPVFLNLILGYMLSVNSPVFITFKHWYILIVFINFIVIYEYYTKPVIADGTFNMPPNSMSTSVLFHYIIIILLVYHLITEINVIKTLNINLLLMWICIVVNIIINIYFLINKNGYSPCLYKLPKSWI